MYNFFLRMTDTLTSQNIDLSSWDTLYSFDTVTPLSNPRKERLSFVELVVQSLGSRCGVFFPIYFISYAVYCVLLYWSPHFS
jgi:hypothetical protein